jgi:hypothetical protein
MINQEDCGGNGPIEFVNFVAGSFNLLGSSDTPETVFVFTLK